MSQQEVSEQLPSFTEMGCYWSDIDENDNLCGNDGLRQELAQIASKFLLSGITPTQEECEQMSQKVWDFVLLKVKEYGIDYYKVDPFADREKLIECMKTAIEFGFCSPFEEYTPYEDCDYSFRFLDSFPESDFEKKIFSLEECQETSLDIPFSIFGENYVCTVTITAYSDSHLDGLEMCVKTDVEAQAEWFKPPDFIDMKQQAIAVLIATKKELAEVSQKIVCTTDLDEILSLTKESNEILQKIEHLVEKLKRIQTTLS